MAIINIDEAKVRSNGPDYNKFDFQKGNNFARVLLPNKNFAVAYVHSLYRSEAMMVADDKGRLKADWEQSTYAGTFHCTGDFDTVQKNPTYGDPDKCAACKSLLSGPRVAGAPKIQYAVNLLRYQTKPNSFEVIGQGVTVELWKHGNEKNVSPIITAIKETEKPINHLDFLIETDGSVFKKLQIQFMFPAAYGKEGNEQLKAAVVAAMDNLYDNDTLEAALGEKVSREEMANNIRAAVTQATAGKDSAPETAAGLFAADPTPAPAAAVAVAEPVTQLATQVEKTVADDLPKVDVSSIDSLL